MKFGGLIAINDLNFEAKRGAITALIGPNGAGKTTVFNCITGFYKPTEGMLTMTRQNGEEYLLERMADFVITKKAKVARTFQNIRLFSGLTVLENLLVAQHNPADAFRPALPFSDCSAFRPTRRRLRTRSRRLVSGWRRSIWSIAPTTRPAICPMVRSGASRSPVQCARIPNCSALMSLPQV